MSGLTFDQEKFDLALSEFSNYVQGSRFASDVKERDERKRFYRGLFDQEFNEAVFAEIVKKLWASLIFNNKDYLVTKIIKDNGIDKLKREFGLLSSRKGTVGERYERFLENIKGMGPAMVTEILCYLDSQNAGVWNDKARKALAWLEVKGVAYEKYKITGAEYDSFNNLAKDFASLLKSQRYSDVDLLFVDYFLWEIWDKHAKDLNQIELKSPSVTVSKSRHDEIRDKIAEIGDWLGFVAETEKQIAIGAEIDVIWRTKIGNLGMVSYAFEVQDRGSIDSLILNLQKAQKNPTVQKLIIVSDSGQIEKIRGEIKDLHEDFRNSCTFWDVEEVENTHQNLEQVASSIRKLNLIPE